MQIVAMIALLLPLMGHAETAQSKYGLKPWPVPSFGPSLGWGPGTPEKFEKPVVQPESSNQAASAAAPATGSADELEEALRIQRERARLTEQYNANNPISSAFKPPVFAMGLLSRPW